jgi:isopentenyldiphosphate isomerase
MAADELIDIYSGTGDHLGTKGRNAVHIEGFWHKTFHCWVIFKDQQGVGWVILQKRSEKKGSWPGYVDVTAAGHYLAGETTRDGLREVQEELGIQVDEKALIPLGMRVCVEEFQAGKINHEFQDVFLLIGDDNLDKYRIQSEELTGLLKVRISSLLELFGKEVESIPAEGFVLKDIGGQLTKEAVTSSLNRDLFIPSLDKYNYKVMILADRALRGDKHLLI